MKPPRGYESLRQYRTSLPNSSYFLTLCTIDRRRGLDIPAIAAQIRNELWAIEHDMAILLRAVVIMPEHVHAFLTLKETLTLGQVVGRLKAKTRSLLGSSNIRWQGNYYEHRLRPDDPVEDVVRYIFLNPYRARLVSPADTYPYFWLGSAEAEWFRPTLDHERPFPEWLA